MSETQYTMKQARMLAGYTLDEASKKIGISRDSLYHYEKGDRFPNVPVIMKIEEVYHLKYENIIFLLDDYG